MSKYSAEPESIAHLGLGGLLGSGSSALGTGSAVRNNEL
jgi:hypothetical protein